ncbi:MAG TPA: response regulator [Terriglobales bacterium]|jgi:CheY-like chemotaxis protein|nr:response regulator [Terriglobales bacterium]
MPLRILVIDDEPGVLGLMQEVLTLMGAEAYTLGSAPAALEMVEQQKFDGILVDIMMPEIDGLEVIRRVRRAERNQRTPIVAVSGSDDRKTMEESLAAGATFFLHKPFDHRSLTRMLNSTRGSMLQERRRHARVPIHCPVRCQAGSTRINAAGHDISEGGIRLLASKRLPEGTKVAISLTLPGQDALFEAPGMVVRAEEEGTLSLKFGDLPLPTRHQLRAFLGAQMERPQLV